MTQKFPWILVGLALAVLAPAHARAACDAAQAASQGAPSDAACLAVGQTFQDCVDCPEMTVLPPGRYKMGAWLAREMPFHDVSIAYRLAIGTTEVTQAQYEALMGENPSRFKGPDQPVEHVSWTKAQEFVRRLAARTGRPYRLPTESEWEYAARGGSPTEWPCGPKPECLNDTAWIGQTQHPQPVGLKAPNAFGLRDVIGNVWEWVADCYHKDYTGAPADGSAWDGEGSIWEGGQCRRVIRGSSWDSHARVQRVGVRYSFLPSLKDDSVGFRVALPLDK